MTQLRTPVPVPPPTPGRRKALTWAPLLAGVGLAVVAGASVGRRAVADPTSSTIGATIQTIAGTGDAGYNGEGLALKDTQLYWPQDTYVDPQGHLWILDWNNHRVVEADSLDSPAYTAIGSGFIGDTRSGPADEASLNHPTSITADSQGRMVLAAWHNWTIKRVNPDGDIEVIVGSGHGPATGGDGGPAIKSLLNLPSSAEFDAAGNLYISEEGARRIRKVDAATGIISTLAGTAGKPGFSGDGGPATAALFNTPTGSDAVPCFKLAIDGSLLYIADTLNNRVRVIDRPDGTITTAAGDGKVGFAGDGGPPEKAEFNDPSGVFVDQTGVLYIADTLNHRIRAVKMPS